MISRSKYHYRSLWYCLECHDIILPQPSFLHSSLLIGDFLVLWVEIHVGLSFHKLWMFWRLENPFGWRHAGGSVGYCSSLPPGLCLLTLTSTCVFALTHACFCSCMPRGRQLQPGVFDFVSLPPPSTVMFVRIIQAICYMWGFMFRLVLGYFNWIVAFTSVFALVQYCKRQWWSFFFCLGYSNQLQVLVK